MARFHFITDWKLGATEQEVYEVLKATDRLTSWWPSVYLRAETLNPGDAQGLGKKVSLLTKGYLPYTLRWNFEVTEVIPARHIALRAEGDLQGHGTWSICRIARTCHVRYDWDISFQKKGLAPLAWLLRPFFAWNHHWAMQQGYLSIQQELARLKSSTEK
jgi:hypothetical protein